MVDSLQVLFQGHERVIQVKPLCSWNVGVAVGQVLGQLRFPAPATRQSILEQDADPKLLPGCRMLVAHCSSQMG